jgi:hypothetical protein
MELVCYGNISSGLNKGQDIPPLNEDGAVSFRPSRPRVAYV